MDTLNARKLRGLPLKLKNGIDAGAEYTVQEWAEELGVKLADIRNTLNTLNQKHKFHCYYPVDGKGKAGIIVNVTQKYEWMEQVLERQELLFLDPQLLSFSSWADVSVSHLRKLLPKIRARLASEMALLTTISEKIKQR